ncbi:hypothetical protein Tco_0573483 [Tanacetum coccineum]
MTSRPRTRIPSRPRLGCDNWLSIVETDKAIHIVETDIVKLVVKIKSFVLNQFDICHKVALLRRKSIQKLGVHLQFHIVDVHGMPRVPQRNTQRREIYTKSSVKEAQDWPMIGLPRWQSVCSHSHPKAMNQSAMIRRDQRIRLKAKGASKKT